MKDEIYDWEIEKVVKENNINHWFPRECCICGEPYGYYFKNEKVVFNGACGCGSIFGDRLASFEEIANLYNKNKNKEFREEFLNYFKIEV